MSTQMPLTVAAGQFDHTAPPAGAELALTDGEVAEEYEAEHGVNPPRPLRDILGDLIRGR